MEHKGLIKQYHTIIEPELLGYSLFMSVLLKIKPTSSAELENFTKTLITIPEITHAAKLAGRYNYHLTVASKSMTSFDKTLDEIKSIEKDLVVDIEVFNILDEPKIDDFTALV